MKKTTLALTCFVCSIAAQGAVGDTFQQDGLTYVVKTETTVGVSGVANEVTACTIASSVNYDGVTYSVVAIEEDAFYWSNVTKISLPETIETIGAGAFRSSPLNEINLPESLTEIGTRAFYNTEVTSIALPQGIKTLADGTFQQCEELLQITLPASLESIGRGVFYKCGFTEIDIPATCAEIGAYAFEQCANLQEISLPEGLVEFKEGLFSGCRSLTAVTLPESVTTIEGYTFQNVPLVALHLPAAVETIKANAFNGTQIQTITVDAANASFVSDANVLYTKDHRFLYLYPRKGAPTNYTLHDDCVAVYGGAFYATEVKEVIFPEGFLGLDAYAFCLSALERVNLPASVELLYEQAFAGTQLKQFTLPAGVTEVSDALLADCKQLTTVTFHDKVVEVGNRVFYNCSALETIYCLGTTPPEFAAWETYTNPFFYVNCDNVTVVCPMGTLNTYVLSEWGDFFMNIREADLSAVAPITGNADWQVVAQSGTLLVKGAAGATLQVVSMNGAVVAEQQEAAGEVRFTNLPAGIYLVNCVKNGKVVAKKVLL